MEASGALRHSALLSSPVSLSSLGCLRSSSSFLPPSRCVASATLSSTISSCVSVHRPSSSSRSGGEITSSHRVFGRPATPPPRLRNFQICAVKKTYSSFDDMLQKSNVPVLVDFYATWCGPCQYMVPILNDVAGALKDTISIVKVDSDKYPELASRFEVQALPTFILFDHGNPIDRFEGTLSAPKLIEHIEDALSSSHASV